MEKWLLILRTKKQILDVIIPPSPFSCYANRHSQSYRALPTFRTLQSLLLSVLCSSTSAMEMAPSAPAAWGPALEDQGGTCLARAALKGLLCPLPWEPRWGPLGPTFQLLHPQPGRAFWAGAAGVHPFFLFPCCTPRCHFLLMKITSDICELNVNAFVLARSTSKPWQRQFKVLPFGTTLSMRFL